MQKSKLRLPDGTVPNIFLSFFILTAPLSQGFSKNMTSCIFFITLRTNDFTHDK